MVVDEKSGYNIDYLKRQIDKYQYISFDMFDTLIKRNVSKPTDVFDIVELDYNKESKKPLRNWKTMRIEAESRARVESNNYEPNIDEIYDQVNLPDAEKKILKELELKWEMKICQQNVDFYPVYEYAKKHAKKIFVTSDMYLDAKTIKKILKDADITFDEIYLSNEKRANKRSGEIFHSIINDNNIEKNQLLHIGDSKRADFWGAKRVGADAVLIPKKINNLKYYKKYVPKTLIENIVISYINNNIAKSGNVYYRIGFEILGIVLYGYVKWLRFQLEGKKIKKVFFLAREGSLLKNAFDVVNSDGEIESKYLYVSRRSVYCVGLRKVKNIEDVFRVCRMRKGVDLAGFFANIGLDIKKYQSYLKKYGCKPETRVRNFLRLSELFDEIRPDVNRMAENNMRLLRAYLVQENFCGNVALGDVGWKGTMQKALNLALLETDADAEISGYYLGITNIGSGQGSEELNMKGYLFDGESGKARTIRLFLNLFESFFLADHGTTLGYKEVGKKIVPVLGRYEYTREEARIFRKIQQGAMDFVKEFLDLEKCLVFEAEISPDFAFAGLYRLGFLPTANDTKLFGGVEYLDTSKTKFIDAKSWIHYVSHPMDLYSDFYDSSWKAGFLRRILGNNWLISLVAIYYKGRDVEKHMLKY